MIPEQADLARPWVTFELTKQRYGIPVRLVREITMMGNLVKLPNVPAYVTGVLNLRGTVVPVVDLRTWLGLLSTAETVRQLIDEMHQREREHRDWLRELEASIREHRPFTRATDPQECAFGKWYRRFTTDNVFLQALLRKFDAPHKAIHAVAATAIATAEREGLQAAQEVLNATREVELAKMIELFGRFRQDLARTVRDTIIVIEHDGHGLALVVDRIESVDVLGTTFDTTETLQCEQRGALIPLIGRDAKDGTPVLLLDVERLIRGSPQDLALLRQASGAGSVAEPA